MKKKFILPALLTALFVGAGVNSVVNDTETNNNTQMIEVANDVNHNHDIQVKRATETSSGETNSGTNMKEMTEDEIAAKEVDDLIEAIGTDITVDSRDAIKAAKEAYEELTYNQQKLVENVDDLKEAIADYNDLIEDNEDVKPIERRQHKTIFTDAMEENKGFKAVMIVLGTVSGLGLIYLVYLGIKKLRKIFK